MQPRLLDIAIFAVVFLLLAPSFSFAGSNDAEIGQYMKYALGENESFSKERLRLTDTYIISIGRFDVGLGTSYEVIESVVLRTGGDNSSNITLLTNAQEIEGLLSEKYALMNLTYDSLYPTSFEMGEILAMIINFNESREPNEGKCKLWIGTDRAGEFPCYDRESCFRACHTPLSNPVASGVGWPFVDAVWKFMNNTREIDGNISSIFLNIENIEGKVGNTEELLMNLELNLENIQNSSNSITESGLFDPWKYSFCWPIPFNRTSLITAKILTKRLKDRMQVVFDTPRQAEEMAEAGKRRMELHDANWEEELAKRKPPHVSFWDKVDSGGRDLLRLIAAETPGMLSPMPTRISKIEWE